MNAIESVEAMRIPTAGPAAASPASGRAGPRLGFGSLLSAIARAFGIRACSACAQRAQRLDAMLSIAMPLRPGLVANAAPCHVYTGRCTGFGRRQCVVAPVSFSPDAETIEHCCSGWFQYPWIEVCDGAPPKRGCGFCFW